MKRSMNSARDLLVAHLGLLDERVHVQHGRRADLDAAVDRELLDQVAELVGGRDDLVVGVGALDAVQRQRLAPDGEVVHAGLKDRARVWVKPVASPLCLQR
jgi:hypothetical protein